jgi:hypothetical protein
MRTIKTASGKEVNIDNVDQEIWEAIGHEFGWLKTAEGANEMDDTPDHTEYAEELPDPTQEEFGEDSEELPKVAPPIGSTVIDGLDELQNAGNAPANIAEWQAERQTPPDNSTIENVNMNDNDQRENRQMQNLVQNQRLETIEQNKYDKAKQDQEEMQTQTDELDAIQDQEKQEEMNQKIVENVQKTVNNTYNSLSYSSNVVTIPLRKS